MKSWPGKVFNKISLKQIAELMERYGFEPLRDLSFKVFMDRERTKGMPARAYLARKRGLFTHKTGDKEAPHSPIAK